MHYKRFVNVSFKLCCWFKMLWCSDDANFVLIDRSRRYKVVILQIVDVEMRDAHFLVISPHSPERRLSASLLHYLSDARLMVFSCHISHSLTPVRTRLVNIETRTQRIRGREKLFLEQKGYGTLRLNWTIFLLPTQPTPHCGWVWHFTIHKIIWSSKWAQMMLRWSIVHWWLGLLLYPWHSIVHWDILITFKLLGGKPFLVYK